MLSAFNRHFIFALALFIAALPVAQGGAFEPVYARHAMVASPEPNAAKAGLQVLRAGGNAFDAAAAIGFALAVTYPAAGNLGGGGFLTGYTADGKSITLDFREMAPGAATADMYLDENGDPDSHLSTATLLASGVPGTPKGLLRFQEDYGRLPRAAVLNPAIRLAEDGFDVPYSLSRHLAYKQDDLSRFESSAKIFFPNGKPLAFGDKLVQRDLGATLRRIRDLGADGFYQGETADLIAGYMQKHGGLITKDDLKNYQCKYREPFIFDYKDYQLITHPLPSSGGVVMAQVLKLVEPFPVASLQHNSSDYVQLVAEAERLAFADRNAWMGDPDYVDVPVEKMVSDEYLDQRRAMIPKGKAGKSENVKPGAFESEQTTHFCVVDAEGNVAAITYTLNGSFGMGAVVEGAGFLLNNEMDDFTAKPGTANMFGLIQMEANKIEPGKRMLSAMTPTIVLKNGKFDMTMGTPGGPTIITTNLQIFLNRVEFGMNIREAIDAGR
ncbi:gamma-glutamyltransferase, partial [bacterium]|nr:gamma-glutamyltransferase [bacterium]